MIVFALSVLKTKIFVSNVKLSLSQIYLRPAAEIALAPLPYPTNVVSRPRRLLMAFIVHVSKRMRTTETPSNIKEFEFKKHIKTASETLIITRLPILRLQGMQQYSMSTCDTFCLQTKHVLRKQFLKHSRCRRYVNFFDEALRE